MLRIVLGCVVIIRWSAIATHLPKRTDNEIKNYWNTHLKKRLDKMGIDPVTHKPKNDALISPTEGPSKTASNLSHMAQWESARLEAEARLVRESKLHTSQHSSSSSSAPTTLVNDAPSPMMMMHHMIPSSSSSRNSLDHAWNNNNGSSSVATRINNSDLIESPTSTLSENNVAPPIMSSVIHHEFVGSSTVVKEEEEWNKGYIHQESSTHLGEYKDGMENSMPFTSSMHELTMTMATTWGSTNESLRNSTSSAHAHAHAHDHVVEEGFTNLLLNSSSADRSLSPEDGEESNINCHSGGGGTNELYEDNKNYWNNILNLMNYSPPSDSPMF